MPEGGPAIGLDFGRRRIGIAVLGEMGLAPQGLATLHNGPGGPDWMALDRIVGEWKPSCLVLGLPLHMDGSEGPMAAVVRRFGAQLQRRYGLPLHWVDERLSSHAAALALRDCDLTAKKRRRVLDQAAACEILSTFLEGGEP